MRSLPIRAFLAPAALVRSHGYTPRSVAEYHENQTLRVLVGTRPTAGLGYDQQAFFFVDGRYIGTDAKEPSAIVRVLSQNDTEVALAYSLYRRGDALGSPSGGQAVVHFQLNNGQLQSIEQLPPTSVSSGVGRY